MIPDGHFDFDTTRRHRVLVLDAGPFTLPGHVQNLPPMSAPLGPPAPRTLAELRGDWSAQNPGQPVPALLPPRNEVWGLAWHSQAGANAADPKDKRFPGLAYCVGGRSLFWGGWSPRLIATEFAGWPAAVVADLNTRLYPVAERQLGTDVTNDFINGPLHDELRARLFANRAGIAGAIGIASQPDLEAPLAVQTTATLSGFFPTNKFSSLPLLLQAVRTDVGRSGGNDAQRRLMVVPRCHVTSLGLGPGNRVNAIRTKQGDLRVGPNAAVFIALGTVESTRLALLSFPNANGRIGRNLMAHLRSNTTVRIPRAGLPAALPSALQASALFVKGRQGGNGPHFHLQITGTGVQGDISDSEIELNQTIPNIDLLDQIKGALAQPGGDDFVVVTIRGIGEMAPDTGGAGPNRIQLDPETDENGVRRAIVTLGLTAADQALWNAMDTAGQQTAAALATAVGGGAPSAGLRYFNPGGVPQWQAAPFTQRDGLGSTHHEGGTLWMGTDPAASVTDTVGRFHEVANAFAVGPALFPVVGSPNPMLGGMALVRRAAEALLAPRLPPGAPVDRDFGFYLAVAAQAGDTARARAWYAEDRQSWERFGRTFDRDAQLAMSDAMLAFAYGRYDESLAMLREVDRLRFRETHIVASMRFVVLDRLRMVDSAIAAGEAYISETNFNRIGQDAIYLAGIRQRLGEMYEAKGNVDKALTHYQAFVDLWKNADQELQPRVRDVRGRIERLQRRRG